MHGWCHARPASIVGYRAETGGAERTSPPTGWRSPTRWQVVRTSALGRRVRPFDGSLDKREGAFERRDGLVDDDLPQHGTLDARQSVLLRALEREQVETATLGRRLVRDADGDIQGGMEVVRR